MSADNPDEESTIKRMLILNIFFFNIFSKLVFKSKFSQNKNLMSPFFQTQPNKRVLVSPGVKSTAFIK
jgi:hypothetical protein